MIKEASKIGIKERTLERARRQLGVIAWFRNTQTTGSWRFPEVAERMQEADRPLEQGESATCANAKA